VFKRGHSPNNIVPPIFHRKRYSRGFYIIAIRRDDDWIYNFAPDFILKEGDLLIGIGPDESEIKWRKCVNPNAQINEINDND
jgi:uncharacterized protein with PhoU and TrkA domain